MTYRLEPAFAVYPGLQRKLVLAGKEKENQWFFTDGAFTPDGIIETKVNSWTTEDWVVLDDKEIIGFFSGKWARPLNNIISFRFILFEKQKKIHFVKAFFEYIDYLFELRGCVCFNWLVAEKNEHAYRLYEKFVSKYFGHRVGKRHNGQMSYTGEISDVVLYEITREEYLHWKMNSAEFKK